MLNSRRYEFDKEDFHFLLTLVKLEILSKEIRANPLICREKKNQTFSLSIFKKLFFFIQIFLPNQIHHPPPPRNYTHSLVHDNDDCLWLYRFVCLEKFKKFLCQTYIRFPNVNRLVCHINRRSVDNELFND